MAKNDILGVLKKLTFYNMKIEIAPSILSANFGKLNEEIASVEAFSDYIHVDVMDGHFVPNLTFGAPVIKCIESTKPLDVHLMMDNPMDFMEDFVKAGADRIYVHPEIVNFDLRSALMQIVEYGVKPAVALKPATPLSEVIDVLDLLEAVMVMTVEPGFGGQTFMHDMLPKIEELRGRAPEINITVDGGINDETSKLAVKAGANILVAGSYVFKAEDREAAIESLRA